MDEILKEAGMSSIDELIHNILHMVENELSEIEDMLYEDEIRKFDIMDKIVILRSQLV